MCALWRAQIVNVNMNDLLLLLHELFILLFILFPLSLTWLGARWSYLYFDPALFLLDCQINKQKKQQQLYLHCANHT